MKPSLKHPGVYIPTLYFVEGLPNALVVLVSVVIYKNLGCANDFITQVTSLFYWPWVLKFLWAPIVDFRGLKKTWIVVAHVVLGLLCLLLSLSLNTAYFLHLSLVLFSLMAFVSATQDIAIDAFYLEDLDKKQQSFFVGVRNAFYKVAWIFGQGGLVFLSGQLVSACHITSKQAWSVSLALCAFLLLLASLFHKWVLPRHEQERTLNQHAKLSFLEVFRSFFQQKCIVAIVFYVLTFRLGDALLLKTAPLFLLDTQAKGGLAISNEQFGIVYGTLGTVFLLLGGILGGILVSHFGLKKTLMPTAILQNLAILLYFLLAKGIAGAGASVSLPLLTLFNALEQFGYGLGTAAYTVFLLQTVNLRFKAGHYALVTALMALGVLVPGYFSGALSLQLGYEHFFLLSFILALPGMISILFLPLARP